MIQFPFWKISTPANDFSSFKFHTGWFGLPPLWISNGTTTDESVSFLRHAFSINGRRNFPASLAEDHAHWKTMAGLVFFSAVCLVDASPTTDGGR